MSKSNYEYECALSAIRAEGGAFFDSDGLEDLPAGWTEVKLSRRHFNPRWVAIQQVKRAMLERLTAQYPESAQTQGQRLAVQLQVDAQFHGLESSTPMYLTEVETVYLAPPETAEEVAEAYNQARELLGLDPVMLQEATSDEHEADVDGDEDDEDEESE